MQTTSLLFPIVLGFSLWPVAAFADGPVDPWRAELNANMARVFPRNVLEQIRLAEAAEKAGKMDEAIQLYEHAAEMEDSGVDANVELGLAYVRAGRYVEGARELGLMRRLTTPHVRHPKVIRAALNEAKKHIGSLKVDVNVEGATVSVDGAEVVDYPYRHVFYLSPGEHNIKATKEGYWMSQTRVHLDAGEEKELLVGMQGRIQTRIIGVGTPVNVHMNVNRGEVPPQSTWPTTLAVVSGVGMGLGVGALALGLVQYNNAKSEDAQATWTGVASIGGVVGAISLTGLIIGGFAIAARPDPPTPIVISPAVTSEGGGVQVHGKW